MAQQNLESLSNWVPLNVKIIIEKVKCEGNYKEKVKLSIQGYNHQTTILNNNKNVQISLPPVKNGI